MIDEEKLDKYLWDLKTEPLFGRPIAETLLKKDSQLRKELIIMLSKAQEGYFKISSPSDNSSSKKDCYYCDCNYPNASVAGICQRCHKPIKCSPS